MASKASPMVSLWLQEDLNFPDQTKVKYSTSMLFFVWGHVLVTSLVVGPKYPTQAAWERKVDVGSV